MEVVALATGRVGSLFSRSTSALRRDVESPNVFDGSGETDGTLSTDVLSRACEEDMHV